MLTQLSALETLQVEGAAVGSNGVERPNFEGLPPGMSQLTEFAVDGIVYSSVGFHQFMTSMPSLVSLHMPKVACPVQSFLQARAPLQRVRNLSIWVYEGGAGELHALCGALIGLERLSLRVATEELFQHLSQLRRLTALRIFARCEGRPAGRQGPVAVKAVEADFLTGLTGLAELTLHSVLSKGNAEADIRCLALLTRLQRLELKSVEAYSRGSGKGPTPKPLARKDFEPLRALQWLESWDLNDAWRMPRGRKNPDDVIQDLCVYRDFSFRHCSSVNNRWRDWRVFGCVLAHGPPMETSKCVAKVKFIDMVVVGVHVLLLTLAVG